MVTLESLIEEGTNIRKGIINWFKLPMKPLSFFYYTTWGFYITQNLNYPHAIIILAFMPHNVNLLHCRKVAFNGTLAHRQSLRHF